MAGLTRRLSPLFQEYILKNTQGGASRIMAKFKKKSPEDGTRNAAILCCLREERDDISVLINVRSNTLSRSPGEACFPGGIMEESDQSLQDAALREAHEEINLKPEQVDVITTLPPMPSNRDLMQCHTVVCTVNNTSDLCLQPNDEVESIFWVPLKTFLTNDNDVHERKKFPIRDNYSVHIDYFNFPGHRNLVVWGLTARMCIIVASIVYSRHPSFTFHHDYITQPDPDHLAMMRYFLPFD